MKRESKARDGLTGRLESSPSPPPPHPACPKPGSESMISRSSQYARGRWRFARLARAVLFGLTVLIGWASGGGAYAATLVSNLGQTTNNYRGWIVNTDASSAMRFDTGSNSEGYTVSTVTLDVHQATTTDLTVSIWSATSATPPVKDASLFTLMNPDPLKPGRGTTTLSNIFTASGMDTLKPDTTYFLVIENTNASAAELGTTTATAEDTIDPTFGWTIGDTPADRLKMQIDGFTGPNVAPTFTSAARTSVAENATTTVLTVQATDEDAVDSVTYTLAGGADQSTVTLDGTSGVLKFRMVPDYEHPTDADADNIYFVQVRATSGTGDRELSADQTMIITVTDVDEPPMAPTAPTIVPVVETTDSLTVRWSVPITTPGSPVTDYDYRYRVRTNPPAGDWTEVTTPPPVTATMVTLTGLTAGTTYEVQVRATNARGTSDWSPSGTGPTYATTATVLSITAGTSVPEGEAATFTLDVVPRPTASTTYVVTYTVSETGTMVGTTEKGEDKTLTFRWNPETTCYTPADETTCKEDARVVSIPTLTDETSEDDSTVTVTLTAVTAADKDGNAVTAPGLVWMPAATVTVTDDDTFVISILRVHTRVPEEDESVVFELTRRGPTSATTTTVTVLVVDDGEVLAAGTADTQSVEFAKDDTTKQLTLRVDEDETWEPHTRVTATVQPDAAYTVDPAAGTATVTVVDNDLPRINLRIVAVGETTVPESVGRIAIRAVARTLADEQPHRDFSVTTSTRGGPNAPNGGSAGSPQDFDVKTQNLHFAPSQFTRDEETATWHAEEGLSTRVIDDLLDEPDERLHLLLERAPGLASSVRILVDRVDFIITDNDEAPGAPTGLTASHGDRKATLSWTMSGTTPPESGTSPVTGYQYRVSVDASTADEPTWGRWTAGPSHPTLTYEVPDLLADTTYTFEVRAVSDAGPGPASNQATATPVFAPRITTATVVDTTVTLVWETALDESSKPPASAFTVHVTDSGATLTPASLTLAGTTITLTLGASVPAAAAATLSYTVPTGMGAMPVQDGDGNPAERVDQLELVNVPAAPALTGATPGDSQVTLEWTAPASDGGAAVDHYEYRHKETSAAAFPDTWTNAGSGLTATVDGLTNGTEYTFEVRAVNVAGPGPAAASRSATPAMVPGAVQNLALRTVHGAGQVVLVWNAPASDGGAAVDRYEYRHKETSAAAFPDTWTDVGLALTATVDGLTNDTEYTFEVRAVNAIGAGQAAMSPAVTPREPPTVTAIEVSSTLTSGDTYVAGESITLKMTFSEALHYRSNPNLSPTIQDTLVSTEEFAPRIDLQVGTETKTIRATASESGSGGITALTFSYPVVAGDLDRDGIMVVAGSLTTPQPDIQYLYREWVRLSRAHDAYSFSEHKVDAVVPTLLGMEVEDSTLTLTYAEALDENSTPAVTAFAVMVAGMARTVNMVTVEGRMVTLTLASAVTAGQAVTLSYTVPTTETAMPLQDPAGNAAPAITDAMVPYKLTVTGLANASVEENVAYSATATATGASDVTWTTEGDDADAFTIGRTTGVLGMVPRDYETPADMDRNNDYEVTVRATAGSGDTAMQALTMLTVIVTDNDDEAPAAPVPTLDEATLNSLTVHWAEPANAGPTITDYDYRYRVMTDPPAGTWTEVTDTSLTATMVTLTGLTAGTTYEVQVRATNDEGTGEWSESLRETTAGALRFTPATVTVTEGEAATYMVVLDSAPSDTVTVTVESADTNAVVVTPAFLTFTVANWNVPQEVTVTGVGDPDVDNEMVDLTHVANGGGYATVSGTVRVTVTDVPVPTPTAGGLVSNIDQTHVRTLTVVDVASRSFQGFSTGPTTGGYTLRSVDLWVHHATSSDVTVAVWTADADGTPNTKRYTLTKPTAFPVSPKISQGRRTFTAPEDATLDPGTSYFVEVASSNSATKVQLSQTDSDAQTGAAGWEIADILQNLDGTTHNQDSLRLQINGSQVGPNRPPTFADATATRMVEENTAAEQAIGDPLTATDPDGDPLIYTLEGTDATTFTLNPSTGQLLTKEPLDYETKSSYTVTVKVDDGREAGTDTITVTVTVTDVAVEPPAFIHARVDGTRLVLTYDKALDEESVPEVNAFTVDDGAPLAVSEVTISGMTVILTLAEAVKGRVDQEGQEEELMLTLSYAAGQVDGIQDDETGLQAVSLNEEPVTNVTKLPELVDDDATVDGTRVVLTYDEALDENSEPFPAAFTVMVADSELTVSEVEINGMTVILTLAEAVKPGETVMLSYDAGRVDGSPYIQDETGGQAVTFINKSVMNKTRIPMLEKATVIKDGTQVELTYDEALDENSEPEVDTFMVMVGGSTREVSSVTIDGMTVILTLVSAVAPGEPVTLSYDASQIVGSPYIQDTTGGQAGSLVDEPVTNVTRGSPERFLRLNREILALHALALSDQTSQALTQRLATLATGPPETAQYQLGGQRSLAQMLHATLTTGSGSLPRVDLKHVLGTSSFVLPVRLGATGLGLDRVTLWGQGRYTRLARDADETLAWDGDTVSAQVGADVRLRPDLLTGVAVTWADSGVDYQDRSGPGRAVGGTHEHWLMNVQPYVGWQSPTGLGLWGTLGYGWGELTIDDEQVDRQTSTLRMQTAAVGASGPLLSQPGVLGPGATTLTLRSDAALTRVKVFGNQEALAGQTVNAGRVRLLLEGQHVHETATGARLAPFVELGVRYDLGDGLTGAGAELGGGLRYAVPRLGLTVEGRGRGLVGHRGYTEWGATGLVQLVPGGAGDGLAVRLAPTYGPAASRVQQIWTQASGQPFGEPTSGLGQPPQAGLEAEVGYGLANLVGARVFTPYGAMTLGRGARAQYRLGWRWSGATGLQVSVEGVRQASLGQQPATQGIRMNATWAF